MNSTFLEALNESQKLSEGPITQAISGAVNKVKGAIAQKNQQASANAKTNTDALKPIFDLLQPIANAQTEFTADNINQIKDAINALPTLDNNSKKQINVMLNQQQKALAANNQNQPQQDPAKTNTQDPQDNGNAAPDTNDTNSQPAQEPQAASENIIESEEFKNLENSVNKISKLNPDNQTIKNLVAAFNALKNKTSQPNN